MNRLSPLQIRPTLAWEQFPDEVVAVDLDRLLYFNLTHGGADLFRCFATPTTVAAVARHLAPVFAAPPDELESAVSRLTEELVSEMLLVSAEAAADTELPATRSCDRPLSDLTLHAHGDLQNLLYLDPVHDAAAEGWPVRQP